MSIKAYVTGALFAVSALAAEAQEVTLDTEGADEDLADLLRQTSLTLAIDPEGDSVPQDYVAAARADYRALLTALYAKGYYGGTISIRVNGQEADRFSPLDAPAQINRIAIVVDPGPLFTFGVTEVTPLAPGTELPDGFATGEPAEAAVITDAARAGVDGWRDVGHAKARVSAENIVARHPGDLLDARVTLAPGPRLTFGPLRISGNEAVRTEAIRRIAGLPVGEVFSPAELEKAARRLRETGAFDSVALREADAIGPGDTLPIDALIDEALPRRFGFGLELSSVEPRCATSSRQQHNPHRNGVKQKSADPRERRQASRARSQRCHQLQQHRRKVCKKSSRSSRNFYARLSGSEGPRADVLVLRRSHDAPSARRFTERRRNSKQR